MAQHDYNLSNNTGALFRADVNGAMQAVVTINSGATEPAVRFPGMLWLDLSGGGDGIVRRRNQANSAWLTDIGQDAVARAAAAAAQATADAAMPKAGGTFTGPINLPGTVPTNNQAVSRAQADAIYQVRLPAPVAGSLVYGAPGGWTNVLNPAANETILALAGGLPTWQSTTTVAAPNMIVRTKSDGTLDPSLIPSVATGLRFRGTFKPAVNAEYPTTGGSGAGGVPATGDFWVIDGLTTGGFTYLTGSLAGVTVYNGDSIALSTGSQWYRMGSSVDIEGVVRTDGSVAMAADFNMGTHSIVEIGGLIARPGTPAPFQGFQLDATNVIVSPQRGTTGPDLPPMATGQIGTDLGRGQLFVGAAGSNTPLIAVPFFSATAAYPINSYVVEPASGRQYRAQGAISAGAFAPSQWRAVLDTQGGTIIGPLNVRVASGITWQNLTNGNQRYYIDHNDTSLAFCTSNDDGSFRAVGFTLERASAMLIANFAFTCRNYASFENTVQLRSQGSGAVLQFFGAGGTPPMFYVSLSTSALSLNRQDDAGAYTGTIISFNRNNGLTTFGDGGIAVPINPARISMQFVDGAATRFYVTGGPQYLNMNLLTDGGAFWAVPLSIKRGSGADDGVAGIAIRNELRVWGSLGADAQGLIRFGNGSGSILFNGSNFTFSHQCFAPAFTPTSDARLKRRNVVMKPRAFDALPFREYERIDTEKRERGIFAQDVETIAPDHVSEFNDVDGKAWKAVNVAGLALEIALNALDRIRAIEGATTEKVQ